MPNIFKHTDLSLTGVTIPIHVHSDKKYIGSVRVFISTFGLIEG